MIIISVIIIIICLVFLNKIKIEYFKGAGLKCLLSVQGNSKGSKKGNFEFGERRCGGSKGSSKGSRKGSSKGTNTNQDYVVSNTVDCDSSDAIILLKKAISVIQPMAKDDPVKKRELNALNQALEQYLIDCSICKSANNDFNCLQESSQKLMRQLPFIKNSIYPWINYDWNYGNYIDNNYSAKATGSSDNGKAYMKNMSIFLKLLDGYITAANPNKKTKPCAKNKNSDYPIYGCQGASKLGCDATHLVKTNYIQLPPYKDNFFKQKITGENSSSYFARTGMCRIKSITKPEECVKKNYEWVSNPIDKALDKLTNAKTSSGNCYKPRYMYLDNSPGLNLSQELDNLLPTLDKNDNVPSVNVNNLKGYIPSVANDLLALTPDKLLKVYNQENVDGHMILQDCPEDEDIDDEDDDEDEDDEDKEDEEEFINYNIEEQNYLFLKILSILILILFILIKLLFKI